MVSEIVMYQSMFVLGILMFGFFSVTFQNYEDYAETTTLTSNLENVAKDIGQHIIELIKRGRNLETDPGSFTVSLDLIMEAQFSNEAYTLTFDTTSTSVVILQAISGGVTYANYTLGYIHGSGDGQIEFSGTLISSNANPVLSFIYDSTGIGAPLTPAERIVFN